MQQSTLVRRLVRILVVTSVVWVVIGVALGLWTMLRQRSTDPIKPGDAVPAFALRGHDGRSHRLADYKGRPVALLFLPDLGDQSLAELRSVRDAMKRFDALGLKPFAIVNAPAERTMSAYQSQNLRFPLLTDEDGKYSAAFKAGQGRFSLVVGANGRVLLPVFNVSAADHGSQVVQLTECCLDTKAQITSGLIGKLVVDSALPRAEGGPAETLFGDKKQKATVIVFLSAECPCSASYNDRIRVLAEQYGPRGVRFVAVNACAGEDAKQIQAFVRAAHFPFPVLRDEAGTVAGDLHAQVTPEAYAMDAQGILRFHGGVDDNRDAKAVTSSDLRNALDFMMAGKNPPRAETAAFGCAIPKPVRPGA